MSSYELTQPAGSITFNSSKIFDAPRSLGTQHAMRFNLVEVVLTAPAAV